jgi:four helix bundle protein
MKIQNSNLKMQNENSKFKIEFNKRLIHFSLEIIKLCKEIRKNRNLWAIADQLIRSATSIGANIIEAKASSSKLDYLKFFQIALKSANETKYWLILINESMPSLKNQSEQLLKEVNEIAKIIGAGVLTMKGKR